MATVYTNIHENNLKTTVLVVLFPFVFVAIVFLFIWAAIALTAAPNQDIIATTLRVTADVAIPTFIVCVLWLIIAWFVGDKMIMSVAGAREISADDAKNKPIFRAVENVAIAAGLPCPRVYIMDTNAMNAFATGRDPAHAAITLTRGIINALSPAELRGVIAHEMSHIGNRDIRLDMMLVTGVGVTVFAADLIARLIFFGGTDDDRKQGAAILFAVWLAFLVFNFIAAPLLRLAISRKREFAADATGAFITRDPNSLADALEKISKNPIVPAVAKDKQMAAMFIESPLKRGINNLLSDHPDTDERIRRLRAM